MHQAGADRSRIDLARLLGGNGSRARPEDLQRAIREGLPYAALEALAGALALTPPDITAVMGAAPRTLARRKLQQRLSPIESDRLYRLARILQLAADTLGTVEKARNWLGRGNRALGGVTPFSMLDTEIGARQVEDVLNHINYGMYA